MRQGPSKAGKHGQHGTEGLRGRVSSAPTWPRASDCLSGEWSVQRLCVYTGLCLHLPARSSHGEKLDSRPLSGVRHWLCSCRTFQSLAQLHGQLPVAWLDQVTGALTSVYPSPREGGSNSASLGCTVVERVLRDGEGLEETLTESSCAPSVPWRRHWCPAWGQTA